MDLNDSEEQGHWAIWRDRYRRTALVSETSRKTMKRMDSGPKRVIAGGGSASILAGTGACRCRVLVLVLVLVLVQCFSNESVPSLPADLAAAKQSVQQEETRRVKAALKASTDPLAAEANGKRSDSGNSGGRAASGGRC